MATEDSSASTAARERGNALYKEGKLAAAEKAYEEAAKLSPGDPSPLSNLSAVHFEMGRYKSSLDYANRAISLTPSEGPGAEKRLRLYARAAKCRLHTLAFTRTQEELNALAASHSDEYEALRVAFAETKDLWESIRDEEQLRGLVLDRLARYRSAMIGVSVGRAVGDDAVCSHVDADFLAQVDPTKGVAMLFCGGADARNLYATMLGMMRLRPKILGGKEQMPFKLHMTFVNHKAAAIARTVLMFDMIHRYAIMSMVTKIPQADDARYVIAYLYGSPFVPPVVVEKMEQHLEVLVETLEAGEHDLFNFFYLPPETMTAVVGIFKAWLELIRRRFPNPVDGSQSRAIAKKHYNAKEGVLTYIPDNAKAQETYAEDNKAVKEFKTAFTPEDFIRRREPALLPLLQAWKQGRASDSESTAATAELHRYLDEHWSFNVTLQDPETVAYFAGVMRREDPDFPDEGTRDEQDRYLVEKMPYGWQLDPIELLSCFDDYFPVQLCRGPDGDDKIMSHLGDMFHFVTRVLTAFIGGRMMIECVVGDASDVMERLRHNALGYRKEAPMDEGRIDPTEFPRTYDVIDMGCTPDYIGGFYPVAIHARPLLREVPSSNLKFSVQLNPPLFRSHSQYAAEYLLMASMDRIATDFSLLRRPLVDGRGQIDLARIMPFMAEPYARWDLPSPATAPRRLPWEKLQPRAWLEFFLHAHLLKLCLPYPRSRDGVVPDVPEVGAMPPAPLYSPLNLTALLRLVARLAEVGYPAHWISAVLAGICSGKISTTARPPRHVVATPEDVEPQKPAQEFCLGPWRAEFTTLLSLWRRLLPFGIVTPAGALVPLAQVKRCSLVLPDLTGEERFGRPAPHTMLVFVNYRAPGHKPLPKVIRDMLLQWKEKEEEGEDKAGSWQEFSHSDRLHIITTFHYVEATKTATFWLRGDVLDIIKQGGGWKASVWRTDSWEQATNEAECATALAVESSWVE